MSKTRAFTIAREIRSRGLVCRVLMQGSVCRFPFGSGIQINRRGGVTVAQHRATR